MNRHRTSSPCAARRQRGSIIAFAAIALSVVVITLSLADIGALYYYKREYQKAADLGAMAGARQLAQGCSAATTAAADNVARNIGGLSHNAPVVEVGAWTRQAQSRFSAGCGEGSNAVRVQVSGTPPRFLMRVAGNAQPNVIVAEGLATSGDPVAVFSVGTRLASVSGSSVVGGVLRTVGIDPGLDLMSYNGLAGVMVTPAGLLEALGIPVDADVNIADFNALLAAEQVTLGQLLDATTVLAGRDDLLGLNAQLLQALRVPLQVANVDNIVLPLGSAGGGNGLFAAITSPVDAALNVGLDALGLVSTAIGIATSGRGIDVATAGLGALGALAGADLTVKVGVVEPPSIGIGGVGTTAYSAQTRVYTRIKLDSAKLLGGVGGLLSSALGTSVNIDLPLVVDLAAAKGTVEELCTPALKTQNSPPGCPGGEDCADIAVDAQVAKICVGDINPNTIFSTSSSCDVGLANKRLLDVNLLGTGLIGLTTHLDVDVLATDDEVVLAAEQKETVNGNLDLGSTVSDLTDALLAALFAQTLNANPAPSPAQRTQMANQIWERVGGTSCASGLSGRQCRRDHIGPAFQQIQDAANGLNGFLSDAVLNPVLGLLGSTLSLNLGGILQNVGNLLNGVGSLLGGLLGGLADFLTGPPCTGGGLLGLNPGTNAECVGQIADALNQKPSGGATSNGLIVLLKPLLDLLKPILDALGTQVLTPLLQNLLGLQAGQTDVTMMALECRDGAVLVD